MVFLVLVWLPNEVNSTNSLFYNEEKTLPLVLKDIPREIPGISKIEVQIVDDGSSDNTVRIAKNLGVDRIVSYVGNN